MIKADSDNRGRGPSEPVGQGLLLLLVESVLVGLSLSMFDPGRRLFGGSVVALIAYSLTCQFIAIPQFLVGIGTPQRGGLPARLRWPAVNISFLWSVMVWGSEHADPGSVELHLYGLMSRFPSLASIALIVDIFVVPQILTLAWVNGPRLLAIGRTKSP